MVFNGSHSVTYPHRMQMLAKLVKVIWSLMLFVQKPLQNNPFIVLLELGRFGQSVIRGVVVVSSTDTGR